MLKKDELQGIISEFGKSFIQSEAEVRSKLIVPLIQWLGYDQALRAEEFPVHGFEGRKKLPVKNADFILFTDSQFGKYRGSSDKDITWVQEHSLLVVEAKKTGEMPEVLGQPQYYSIWTKSVAYLVTDGVTIKGRIVKPFSADISIIVCKIDDLPNVKDFLKFSDDNTKKINETGIENLHQIQEGLCLSSLDGEFIRYLSPDEEISLPEHALNYVKNALGKNANGLSKYELLHKFLNMTDSYLDNDYRYDIPKYMIDIPRRFIKAELYVNNELLPTMQGEMVIFYRNEIERYEFNGDNVYLPLAYSEGKLAYIGFGYEVLDLYADQRLKKLQKIQKLVNAKKIEIILQDDKKQRITISSQELKKVTQQDISVDYWIEEMKKIQEIEKHFGTRIKLKTLKTPEETEETYRAVDVVYSGMQMKPNICFQIDCSKLDDDIDLQEPLLITSGDKTQLPCITIHECVFTPQQVYLLPTCISKGEKKKECILFSVQYEMIHEE